LGNLKDRWVPHDVRDEVVDFVNLWSEKTEIAIRVLVLWLGISLSKFYAWRKRYGKVNEHNAQVPRDHWLLEEEKEAILQYEREHPLEGYRRLTFMMLDEDVAAARSGHGVSRTEVGGSAGTPLANDMPRSSAVGQSYDLSALLADWATGNSL